MTDIEVTVNGKTYRGSYLFKPAAQGSGTVVVNYDGGVAEAPVIGRDVPVHTAKNLLRALVAKSHVMK